MNTPPVAQDSLLSRRPYKTPAVATFGSIAKLTQGSGGTKADKSNMARVG